MADVGAGYGAMGGLGAGLIRLGMQGADYLEKSKLQEEEAGIRSRHLQEAADIQTQRDRTLEELKLKYAPQIKAAEQRAVHEETARVHGELQSDIERRLSGETQGPGLEGVWQDVPRGRKEQIAEEEFTKRGLLKEFLERKKAGTQTLGKEQSLIDVGTGETIARGPGPSPVEEASKKVYMDYLRQLIDESKKRSANIGAAKTDHKMNESDKVIMTGYERRLTAVDQQIKASIAAIDKLDPKIDADQVTRITARINDLHEEGRGIQERQAQWMEGQGYLGGAKWWQLLGYDSERGPQRRGAPSLKLGDVVDGMRFNGGNPRDKANWSEVTIADAVRATSGKDWASAPNPDSAGVPNVPLPDYRSPANIEAAQASIADVAKDRQNLGILSAEAAATLQPLFDADAAAVRDRASAAALVKRFGNKLDALTWRQKTTLQRLKEQYNIK